MNDYSKNPKKSPGISARTSERMRQIFGRIVDLYLETGSPVGSRAIAERMDGALSSASIRAIMAELENNGLLFQPHASAGRLPTHSGLRLFVDGLLEVGGGDAIPPDMRSRIDAHCNAGEAGITDALDETTRALSGLARCASLVICPKHDEEIRHVEFVPLGISGEAKALVVIVTASGQIENRIISLDDGIMPAHLVEAGNLMNTLLAGTTLAEAARKLGRDIETRRTEISYLAAKAVESGIAVIGGGNSGGGGAAPPLILHGQAHLLDDVTAHDEIDKIRNLLAMLDARENTLSVLEAVQAGSGVQIFIGAENALFGHTDCSMIIAPYKDISDRIIGAVGVIGPTRMNYSAIIPLVNYTGEAITKMLK